MIRALLPSVLFAVAYSSSCLGASPAEQLAIDSFKHLESRETMLGVAIKNGDKNDYSRFIWMPTSELMQRWPRLGNPDFDKYARCNFALSAFLSYSEDQFNARGKLSKQAVQAKDYFEQKRLCEQAIGRKLK